jgi:hypothetical protein
MRQSRGRCHRSDQRTELAILPVVLGERNTSFKESTSTNLALLPIGPSLGKWPCMLFSEKHPHRPFVLNWRKQSKALIDRVSGGWLATGKFSLNHVRGDRGANDIQHHDASSNRDFGTIADRLLALAVQGRFRLVQAAFGKALVVATGILIGSP